MSDRELNCILFDQLTILERIERALEEGGIEGVRKEISHIKREINRKLYQDVQLVQDND